MTIAVRHCGITIARVGVARLHRHHRPPVSGLVAFEVVRDGWPIAWAIVGRPVSRVLDAAGWVEVTRVATDGTPNACSMLYGAAARWARRGGAQGAHVHPRHGARDLAARGRVGRDGPRPTEAVEQRQAATGGASHGAGGEDPVVAAVVRDVKQLRLIVAHRPHPGPVIYASRTGTGRSLALFREWGWRLMVSARGVLRTEGFAYALDNGAWTAHQRGESFSDSAFLRALTELGAAAEWVVVPDVVADAVATLAFAERWLPLLGQHRPMLVLQDGMTPGEIDAWRDGRGLYGVFVGGSSGWKDATLAIWAGWARDRGLVCHVGRVNTLDRLRRCVEARVDSVDGSGVSRFTDHALVFRRWCVDLGVS